MGLRQLFWPRCSPSPACCTLSLETFTAMDRAGPGSAEGIVHAAHRQPAAAANQGLYRHCPRRAVIQTVAGPGHALSTSAGHG